MLVEGTRLGPYQIEKLLGVGGMGEVYKALDTRLDRIVAIKVLNPFGALDNRAEKQFLREAKIVGGLNHPNILALYDIGMEDGVQFAVIEFLEGLSLRERIEKGRLSLEEIWEVGKQLGAGLSAAHAKSVIHCDLKPENIFLTDEGTLKILDFGLARLSSNFQETPSGWSGTIAYAAPEQIDENISSMASDLFSLGLILFECIEGRNPFLGPSPIQTLYGIMSQPLPPLSRKVPQEWHSILSHLTAKKHQGRFPHAHDFLQAWRAVPPEVTNSGTMQSLEPMPEVCYTENNGVKIAYQVVGDGPVDMVFVMGWVSHLEYFWKEPHFAAFLKRLSKFTRLILFDKRGTGLSDKVPINELPSLEVRMDDVRAVMEACGSKKAYLFGVSEGGPMSALFAATYPDRTHGLIMFGSYARRIWAPDYPWAPTPKQRESFLKIMEWEWGGPVGIEDRAPSLAQDPEFRLWWSKYLSYGASTAAAVALTKMNAEIDVRDVLPSIRVPTLVLHRRKDACLKWEEGQYLASRIPGSNFVSLPGADHLPFVGKVSQIINEVRNFCRPEVMSKDEKQTLFGTVLYIKRLPKAGQAMTRFGQDGFQTRIRDMISQFRGEIYELDELRLCAKFDGPIRALSATQQLIEFARKRGEPVSAGIHAGEMEIQNKRLWGEAPEKSRKIAEQAELNSILISGSVKDLIAGGDFKLMPWQSHHEDVAFPLYSLGSDNVDI